jgi:hypothetical protein
MKTLLKNLLTPLSAEEVTLLTSPVKETLAPGFKNPKSKIFTQAELWNIQRQKRTINRKRIYCY